MPTPPDSPVWPLPVIGPAPLEPPEERWEDLPLDAVQHVAVGDLVAAYRAAGLHVRLQVNRA